MHPFRLYKFLSQIFDYGNTDLEKRAIFFKRLLPLLKFGGERERIDVSKIVLTHHNLKNLGKAVVPVEGDLSTILPTGTTPSDACDDQVPGKTRQPDQ